MLVLGGGVVGLLSGVFACHYGAEGVLADPDPSRLTAARGLGLEAVDDRDVPAWQESNDPWRHGALDRGADLVLQCRGQASSLQTALPHCDRREASSTSPFTKVARPTCASVRSSTTTA